VPYIKYRGERLRVDEGAQGVIFESEDLLLTLSGNLSLPADDDTPEREGMDELEAIIEIGPAINYRFYRLQDSAWWIDLPLRYAYTVDGELENIGWIFQPRLSWRKPAIRLGEWKLRLNFGPLYASEDHHAYWTLPVNVRPIAPMVVSAVFAANSPLASVLAATGWVDLSVMTACVTPKSRIARWFPILNPG
jgi:hypothetical protein